MIIAMVIEVRGINESHYQGDTGKEKWKPRTESWKSPMSVMRIDKMSGKDVKGGLWENRVVYSMYNSI